MLKKKKKTAENHLTEAPLCWKLTIGLDAVSLLLPIHIIRRLDYRFLAIFLALTQKFVSVYIFI